MLRPISRKWDLAEHAYPVELDTLATLFEGISEANTISFAGAEAFRDGEEAKETNHNGGNMSAVLNVIGDQLGRRRVDAVGAPPGPRQRRDLAAWPPTNSWSGSARSVGRDGHHRARLRLRLGRGVHHRQARRRRVRDQRREDLRHRRFARHPHRGVGDAGQVAGPRGDQVVHRAARASRRDRRAARGQARHQGLRHRGDPVRQCPHPQGQPARQPGDPRGEGFCRGHGDLRQHPAHRRGDGRRHRPRRARGTAQDPHRRRRGDLLRQARARPERRRPRSSCGWRPTGRPATC